MSQKFSFQTSEADQGDRLDRVLARHIPHLSRVQARKLLALGGVFVDGKRTKVASRALRAQQKVVAHWNAELLHQPTASTKGPAPLFTPVYEDAELLVVDKPSGLFTAPTPESDQNNLLTFLEQQYQTRLHLIHRLDRPTSGLLVFARTAIAAAHLSEQFRSHSIERRYLALLVGPLEFEQRKVELPLQGKDACTVFIHLEKNEHLSLVQAELFTGRTHQVRLHAESLGHPIAGDSKYGRIEQRKLPARPPRLALHAEQLHLTTLEGRRLQLTSPWPEELSSYFAHCGSTGSSSAS